MYIHIKFLNDRYILNKREFPFLFVFDFPVEGYIRCNNVFTERSDPIPFPSTRVYSFHFTPHFQRFQDFSFSPFWLTSLFCHSDHRGLRKRSINLRCMCGSSGSFLWWSTVAQSVNCKSHNPCPDKWGGIYLYAIGGVREEMQSS